MPEVCQTGQISAEVGAVLKPLDFRFTNAACGLRIRSGHGTDLANATLITSPSSAS